MSSIRQILSDERLYVAAWMRMTGVVVEASGALTDAAFRLKNEIFTTLWLDYKQALRAANAQIAADNDAAAGDDEAETAIKGVSDKDMERAFNEFITNTSTAVKMQSIEEVRYSDDKDDQLAALATWLHAITDTHEQKYLAVMAHWMWLVKRRMYKLPVNYHVMPVIVSEKQGTGKSTAIRKLSEPLANFLLEIESGFLKSEKNFFALGKHFIGLMDEMAGAARTEVDQLKRIITAEHVSARRLHTNDVYKVSQLCSFIGTSNKSTGLLINDTGMRRFYDIPGAEKINWEVINELDYVSMWQSINENLANGYILPYLEEVGKDQEALATENPFHLFCEANKIYPHPADGTVTAQERLIKGADLYAKYSDWCKDNGFTPLNSAWFGKNMRIAKFQSKKTMNGINYYVNSPQIAPGKVVDIGSAKS